MLVGFLCGCLGALLGSLIVVINRERSLAKEMKEISRLMQLIITALEERPEKPVFTVQK